MQTRAITSSTYTNSPALSVGAQCMLLIIYRNLCVSIQW